MEEETESVIDKLPEELVLKILSYSELESKTLLNFGKTCKKFNNLVQDPLLWKKKLQTRYPQIYDAILLYGTDDFFEQFQYVQKTENKLLKELKGMSPRYFWQSRNLTFDDAQPYFALCKDRNISLMCVHSILVDTIQKSGNVIESDNPSTSNYTLTVQYYATYMVRFIMDMFLMLYWRGMKLVRNHISTERALNFCANWINTFQYTDYNEVKELLDNLADEVIKELPSNHPIHSIPPESRENWCEEDLVDNIWQPEHNHAVQLAIRHVIYNKKNIKMDIKISYNSIHIPEILKKKKGHPIALAVLYESVARRCGIKCRIVTTNDNFCLDWCESYSQPSPQFRINLINGNVEKKRVCPFAVMSSVQSKDHVPEIIIDTLIEEFRKMLDNERIMTLVVKVELLAEVMHGTMNTRGGRYLNKYSALINNNDLTQLLIERPDPLFRNFDPDFRQLTVEFACPSPISPAKFISPKRTVYRNRRSTRVHFAVGMVCGHCIYNYTCVVTGWDALCAAPSEWQMRMGVDALVYKSQQPFYNVYASDGTTRYVAQENLKLLVGQRPKIIEDVIGKEFSHFNGTFYIPNKQKREEYPDEQQVIAAYRRAPTLLMSTCKLVKPVPGHMQYFNWR